MEFSDKRYPLKSLGDLFQGLLLSRYREEKEDQGQLYPLVQLRDLDNLVINPSELELVRLSLPSTEGVLLEEGDVLITIKGASQKASVIDESGVRAVAGQNMAVFRPNPAIKLPIVPIYLAGLLRSSVFESELVRLYRQSTGTRSISLKQLGTVLIPLPSSEVQQHFADLFLALEAFTLASQRAVQARQNLMEQSLTTLLQEIQ